MQHRRGELCSPVKRIYTKSRRTQFAPTKYIVFLWVVKKGRRGNRPQQNIIKVLIYPVGQGLAHAECRIADLLLPNKKPFAKMQTV